LVKKVGKRDLSKAVNDIIKELLRQEESMFVADP